MLDLLLHTSPEPIFIYEIENLQFLEVNPAALDIYGYSREEFLQMDLTDLYAPDDIQTLLDSSNAKNQEKVFTGPWKHKKRDGTTILVEISKLSFIYKGKKAYFNIVRDVTEKIMLLKESRIFRAMYHNVEDLVFITDSEGFIQQNNQSVVSLLKYSNTELINMSFLTLLNDEERTNTNTNIFIAKNKKQTKYFSSLKNKDNNFLKGEFIYNPIYDFNSQIIAYCIIFKPEKKANEENKFQEQQGTKSNEVVIRQKEGTVDFSLLSFMFHEILTPLNVILGFHQEVCDSIEEPTAEQKEAIDIIDQNRSILLQSMNEILEYSQLETQNVEVEAKNVTFTDILDSVQENTKKTAERYQIEFSYGKISSSLMLETDIHKLETLVTLLVSIAMRLTNEKMVFLSANQTDDQYCIISIRDNSGNISQQLLDKLSKIFSDSDEDLSSDLGLSKVTVGLTKKILKILSGNIETVNKGDEITEFGFSLPLKYNAVKSIKVEEKAIPVSEIKKDIIENRVRDGFSNTRPIVTSSNFTNENIPVQRQQPVPKPVQSSIANQTQISKTPGKLDFSQMKCLYIEDQIDSQTLFKVQMKDLKIIDFAFNFDSALPLLHDKQYDFIVIDINLQSQFNGIDVLKLIRSLPGYHKTPIIAVTAYLLPGDKEKFIASGFNGFVAKPILRSKLLDILERIVYMP